MSEDEKNMGQELIAVAKQLPPTETFSLKPRTFEEAYRFSNLIAESDMVPKDFQKKPANVLVAITLGMELGVSPMQALQSMYVINGRPSIFGDILPAVVFASGLCEEFDEEGDDTTATCTVKRRGFKKPISRTFTWEDAKRAKAYEHGQLIPLTEKQTYKSFPKRMLQMRARAWALRDTFPDVLKGVAVYEEVQDESPSIEIQKQPEKPLMQPQPKEKDNNGAPRTTAAKPESVVEPEPRHYKEVAESPSEKNASEVKPQENQKRSRPRSIREQVENIKKAEEQPIAVSVADTIRAWIGNCPDEEIFAEPADKHPTGERINLFLAKFNDIEGDEARMDLLRLYNDSRAARRKTAG